MTDEEVHLRQGVEEQLRQQGMLGRLRQRGEISLGIPGPTEPCGDLPRTAIGESVDRPMLRPLSGSGEPAHEVFVIWP